MVSSVFVAVAASLVAVATAQNYTTSGPLNVTASQVPEAQRETWCASQLITCPQICGGQASPNTCNSDDLSYVCTCTDGAKPNISAYSQTLPFFVCEEWKSNCVLSNANELVAQQACLSVTCGQKNASAIGQSGGSGGGSGSGSSSAAPSATGGSGGGSGSSTTSSKGAAATKFAANYGTQILAGGMLAAFGLAL